MVNKNIYENEFKTTSKDENDKLLDDRINYFKSTKNNIIYKSKDNTDREIFETENKKKDFGKNRYFVDKGDGSNIGIYKVKKNLEPYSKFKNSELVYILKVDNSKLNDIKNGKRVIHWKEKGINSKN